MQTINAAPEKVFFLLCPVREAEWLDDWQYAMIYSESGLIEEKFLEAITFREKSMNYFLKTGNRLKKEMK